jgi:cytochrome c2
MRIVTLRRFVAVAGLAVLVGASLVAFTGRSSSGSSSVTAAELARGRTLFQTGAAQGCGFCHTLASAATVSTIGPSLDDEMREVDQRSATDAQLARYVLGWIDKGECLNSADASRCMPRQIFTGANAADVATFVAVCGRTPGHPGCAPVAGSLPGEALVGEHLFETRGCVSCHYSAGGPSMGPPLVGVAGSKVALADGRTVTATDAYLAESIAAPDRQIVEGYQRGMMSAWVDPEHVTRGQIRALVAYLKTLR